MSDDNSIKGEELETNSIEQPKSEALDLENTQEIAEEIKEESASEVVTEITPSAEPETAAVKKKVKKNSPVEEIVEVEKPANDNDELPQGDENHDDEEDEEDDENNEENAQKDYHSLSPKELILEFEKILKSKSIPELKHEVDEIRNEFNTKFQDELEQKKEEFLAEGGNIIDFHFSSPDKKEFNSLYFDYQEKRNAHYKNKKNDLQANLQKRNELIEELKGLLNAEENINTTYKHFKDIQEKWHISGAIPRDKYNIVWNTYHHHVENFYDFLHLNREFRDLDFKHNLEKKLKLIIRAEELQAETNIDKAFRELQMLHKMWKEDIGPVAKEYRDSVWDKFSEATKVIHDRRFESLKELEATFEKNYELKKDLISQINEVISSTNKSHQGFQNGIKKIQELRDKYFEIGKVPRNKTKEIWSTFKEATRNFNREKNDFYKNLKQEQFSNLEKKLTLIKIAEDNKDSEDFEVVTNLMKKIQNDWRKIGHVPRKDSDKIWKKFKAACNHYFDRVHAQKSEANKVEIEHYNTKKELLDTLSNFKLSKDSKKDIESVKEMISQWKAVGRVPYNKKGIEQDFNKKLDGTFAQLDLGKKETELIKFENKLNSMASQEDDRQLQHEQFSIGKKIDEIKNEILQLENNLGFFQNVDSKNPLVKEVHSNIARQKEQLEVWKAKLSKIRSVINN